MDPSQVSRKECLVRSDQIMVEGFSIRPSTEPHAGLYRIGLWDNRRLYFSIRTDGKWFINKHSGVLSMFRMHQNVLDVFSYDRLWTYAFYSRVQNISSAFFIISPHFSVCKVWNISKHQHVIHSVILTFFLQLSPFPVCTGFRPQHQLQWDRSSSHMW